MSNNSINASNHTLSVMERSCCICGMILAHEDSDFPQWCKDIRALCWFENQIILSGQGSMDGDIYPFRLPISSNGFERFDCQRNIKENSASCYPFHSACWTIILESDQKGALTRDVEILYKIFDSVHYWCHSLRWGHSYFLERLLPSVNTAKGDHIINHRSDPSVLADPSVDILSVRSLNFQRQPPPFSTGLPQFSTYLGALPLEILYNILCHLDFKDVRILLLTHRYPLELNSAFWESRFWLTGETGFAGSILSSERSQEEQFFAIRSELRHGSNMMNFRNRQRIWQLGSSLNRIVYAASDLKLCSNLAAVSMEQQWGPAISCLALKGDSEGCRELKQISVPLNGEIRTLTLSYISLFKERLVCGLTFVLCDGQSTSLGYRSVLRLDPSHTEDRPENYFEDSPQHLWFICSPSGFKHISLEYPKEFLKGSLGSGPVALARRSLEGLTECCVGLDSMRLVRFSANALVQKAVNDILWLLPYPSMTPSFHLDDVDSLIALQNKSFVPASFHTIPTSKLLAIKIYSPLGHYAGITGIGFLDNDHKELTWGAVDDSASLVFFLRKAEHLAKVVVFRRGSLACHLQFTTNLGRTSEHFPKLPNQDGLIFERVEFEGPDIEGFCGCFTVNPMQLHCFGVLSKVETISTQSTWTTVKYEPVHKFWVASLGGIRNHGHYQTCLDLQKNYRSIQASITTAESKYRRIGQVTGLLFHAAWSDTPQLLGQFTSFGERHDLEDGEEIIDIHVTTTVPIVRNLPRLGPTQVQSLVVVTNQRSISWGKADKESKIHRKTKAIWEFNAIFDRLTCI